MLFLRKMIKIMEVLTIGFTHLRPIIIWISIVDKELSNYRWLVIYLNLYCTIKWKIIDFGSLFERFIAMTLKKTFDNWFDGIVLQIMPLFKWETFIKLDAVFPSSNQKQIIHIIMQNVNKIDFYHIVFAKGHRTYLLTHLTKQYEKCFIETMW